MSDTMAVTTLELRPGDVLLTADDPDSPDNDFLVIVGTTPVGGVVWRINAVNGLRPTFFYAGHDAIHYVHRVTAS